MYRGVAERESLRGLYFFFDPSEPMYRHPTTLRISDRRAQVCCRGESRRLNRLPFVQSRDARRQTRRQTLDHDRHVGYRVRRAQVAMGISAGGGLAMPGRFSDSMLFATMIFPRRRIAVIPRLTTLSYFQPQHSKAQVSADNFENLDDLETP